MTAKSIVVREAREHNLKGVTVSIPRDRLVVITGLSGSGKSSLAFDTIYAEGQRRYVESLSAYARQFLEQMEKPNVESIEGLPPTISIEQRSGVTNPRSTVATTTEIYDKPRVLFARVGTPHCYKCDRVIERQSPQRIVEQVLAFPAGSRVSVLAPVVRGRKGEHREVFRGLKESGFVRARVDGKTVEIAPPPILDKKRKHTIEAVVDRLNVTPAGASRLAESVETALKAGSGLAIVSLEENGAARDHVFSELYACPACGISYDEVSPRMFSFNSPYGACGTCAGLGTRLEFDVDLVVPDRNLPLGEGAIKPWRIGRRMTIYYNRLIRRFAESAGVDPATPFADLPEKVRDCLLHGSAAAPSALRRKLDFEGVLPNLTRRFATTESEYVKHRLHQFMSESRCPECKGTRLKKQSLAVRVGGGGGKNIHEATGMSTDQALAFFRGLAFGPEETRIASPILKEITSRLQFMTDVGLDYLTLDRTSGTLSGGEAQRIRLATQVGSGLVGVCYVLDEPTIGLHSRDNDRLIATLKRLRDTGNTVIVVEHDEDTIRAADWLIDLGPGAGAHGGEIVAQGTPDEVAASPKSLTGKYLRGDLRIEIPAKRRPVDLARNAITVRGARENNLKNVTARFPLGVFCCVTGVSGSGKSTLVSDIFFRAVTRALHGGKQKPGAHARIEGLDLIDKVIEVDQSPIGRTPRSNAVTYTGAFDLIRKLYAQTPEAKIRGYGPGRFSFNVKGGRCEACEGQGTKMIEMHFLPDVYVTCEACKGTRYNKEALEVTYKGKSIADVLAMRVEEGVVFFKNFPQLKRILQTLQDVGLGYVALGQSSTTLSGGEAQRIKLASELGRRDTGRTLYIMDEPTVGLHFADISNLMEVINRLTSLGNTFVVIEHNLDVVKTADWVIDMGLEGGDGGGRIVVAGTPEEVAAHPESHTGRFLRKVLAGGRPEPAGAPISSSA